MIFLHQKKFKFIHCLQERYRQNEGGKLHDYEDLRGRAKTIQLCRTMAVLNIFFSSQELLELINFITRRSVEHCTPHADGAWLYYGRAALAWTKKKPKKCSLRNEKLKANRASETEEQRKERLSKVAKRIEQEGEQKYTRGKEKVVRNRRPPEIAPGHSQKIEVR